MKKINVVLEPIQNYPVPEFTIGYKMKGSPMSEREAIRDSKDCAKLMRTIFDSDRIEWVEEFAMICLNRANKPIGLYKVSQGGVAGTVADPKIVFQTALLCNASSIVIGHNHPSGNLQPSQADIDITKKIKQGGATT